MELALPELLERGLWDSELDWQPSGDVYSDEDYEGLLDPLLHTPATSPLPESPDICIKAKTAPVLRPKPRPSCNASFRSKAKPKVTKAKGKKRGPRAGNVPRYIKGHHVPVEIPGIPNCEGMFLVINFRKDNAWTRNSGF